MSEVCTCVDARDHDIDRFFEVAQRGERHTIGWGTITGESLCAICETDFLDAECAIQCFDMPASRPISVGCQHGNFSKLPHFLHQREQAGCHDAIVVCYKNMFCHFICSDLNICDAFELCQLPLQRPDW